MKVKQDYIRDMGHIMDNNKRKQTFTEFEGGSKKEVKVRNINAKEKGDDDITER